jgi:hypothetical protein
MIGVLLYCDIDRETKDIPETKMGTSAYNIQDGRRSLTKITQN